ncbi:hypothetical protein SKAU_G00135960 [Synaphobranchus kaupii]|uniref:SH3 domain-containing protein n=1 Tax=Synaphobranchus kaupii TaxID=118154 RepID=A0A9Q1FRB0_SYNKA|nr:hypothetical protein SKAU_G00135960 [Synaphobranchus kaupii]
MTAVANKELVLVEFEYQYTARDGGFVSIKPNEQYILVSRTNDHWWHVRKDEQTKPFYIPAKYVKELPVDIPSPLDLIMPNGPTTSEPFTDKSPVDLPDEMPDEVTIRLHSLSGRGKRVEDRMSTFGIPQDLQELNRYRLSDSVNAQQTHHIGRTAPLSFSKNISEHVKRHNLAPSTFSPADSETKSTQSRLLEMPVIKEAKLQKSIELPELPVKLELRQQADFTQDSENIYETIPDIQDVDSKASSVMGRVPAPAPPFIPVPFMVEDPSVAPTPVLPPLPATQPVSPANTRNRIENSATLLFPCRIRVSAISFMRPTE